MACKTVEVLQRERVRYFVAKCRHISDLHEAMRTCVWACRHRDKPPQPYQILSDAFLSGKVILVFSVNKSRRWQGYATMMSRPLRAGNDNDNDQNAIDEANTAASQKQWHKFDIRWETLNLRDEGENCLPFSETVQFTLPDGTPLNKARNLQELDANTGSKLCSAISKHLQLLSACKSAKEKCTIEKLGESFFTPSNVGNHEETWKELINKVETMGTVVLACCFGSQRYNVHVASSDVDMFVVYAAETSDLLGLRKVQHGTIKNKETDTCDFTIHELSRYCQLLIDGDPFCVETLFLHPSSIYMKHSKWEELLQWKSYFLTKQCVDKYTSNAVGGKGIRLLDKLTRSQMVVTMTPKISKLSYIIIRLLENAREVCHGNLQVYREEGSPGQQLLLDLRAGQVDHTTVRSIISRLLTDIEASKDNIAEEISTAEIHKLVENWLIKLRYENLKTYMATL